MQLIITKIDMDEDYVKVSEVKSDQLDSYLEGFNIYSSRVSIYPET